MLGKVKELLVKWKVQVALVGGVLVVATAFGTCSFDPSQSSSDNAGEVEAEPAAAETTTETTTEATTEATTE